MADSDRPGMVAALRRLGLWVLLALASLAAVGPALGGDRAALSVIGYSPDARYFAFEEYGVQDGSGFAYSAIYVVDLRDDVWVVGTPVRVQAKIETEALSDVRATASANAAQRLKDFGIGAAAQLLAANGDGALDTDGRSLRFGLSGLAPGVVDGKFELVLDQFEAATNTPCKDWFGMAPFGYALTLRNLLTDAAAEAHRDDSLPRSRGCPTSYWLSAVYAPLDARDLTQAVAIISSFPRGFEGPDRRFIAVPLGQAAHGL